ncbi:MAG: Uma2 family endonuclease [Merismopediaceae bacterium]|nr:Uma2 family endonuclease [Merismopediaceae bacterium]
MTLAQDRVILYPDSDGQPRADNTLQFRWIVLIKENLECLFQHRSDVFVAGDLLWYPVEGHPEIRVAPDAMVVFGRPPGDPAGICYAVRGSYRQWQEANIAPQVVFEVLSPGNTLKEMAKKLAFYERYGVEEYYIYDPDRLDFTGYQRVNDRLAVIEMASAWVSPRLQIRFVLTPTQLEIYDPSGQRFLTMQELSQRLEQEQQRATLAEAIADEERQRATLAELEVARLRALLQQAGLGDGAIAD